MQGDCSSLLSLDDLEASVDAVFREVSLPKTPTPTARHQQGDTSPTQGSMHQPIDLSLSSSPGPWPVAANDSSSPIYIGTFVNGTEQVDITSPAKVPKVECMNDLSHLTTLQASLWPSPAILDLLNAPSKIGSSDNDTSVHAKTNKNGNTSTSDNAVCNDSARDSNNNDASNNGSGDSDSETLLSVVIKTNQVIGSINKLPAWVYGPATHLQDRFKEKAMFQKWLQLECMLDGMELSDIQLKTESRPEEVAVWKKYHRQMNRIPSLDVPQFQKHWIDWYIFLQEPARFEREDDKIAAKSLLLPRFIRSEAKWDGLRRGGPNGVFILILTLYWWSLAVEGEDDMTVIYERAVDDVNWVLDQIIALGVPSHRSTPIPKDDDNAPTAALAIDNAKKRKRSNMIIVRPTRVRRR